MPLRSKGPQPKAPKEKKKKETTDAQKHILKPKKLVCTEPKITSISSKLVPGKDLSITLILSNQKSVMTSVKSAAGQNQIKEIKKGVIPARKSVSTICLLEENEKEIHLCANCSSSTNVRKTKQDYMISCSKCSRIIGRSASVETLLNRLIKKALLDCGTQSPYAIDSRDNKKTFPSNCKSTNTFIELQSKSICAVPSMTTRSCTNVQVQSSHSTTTFVLENQGEEAICSCIAASGLQCNEENGKCCCSQSPDLVFTVSPVTSTGSDPQFAPPTTKEMSTGRNIRNVSTSIPASIQDNETDTIDLLGSAKCPQPSKLLVNKSVEVSVNPFRNMLNDKHSLKSSLSPHLSSRTRLAIRKKAASFDESILTSTTRSSYLDANKWIKTCTSMQNDSSQMFVNKCEDCRRCVDDLYAHPLQDPNLSVYDNFLKTLEDAEDPTAITNSARYWRETSPRSAEILGGELANQARYEPPVRDEVSSDRNTSTDTSNLKVARYYVHDIGTDANPDDHNQNTPYSLSVRKSAESCRPSKRGFCVVLRLKNDVIDPVISINLTKSKYRDAATTDMNVASNKSACVLTTQCVLPTSTECKYVSKSGKHDTPCLFVYGDPVCAVHKCVSDVETQATEQEILQNAIPGRNDVGVLTPLFDMLPEFGERDGNNSGMGTLLSPRVYQALYETTRMLVNNDDASEHPVKETTCAYMQLPLRHQRLASDATRLNTDMTDEDDADYHARISAETSAQTSLTRLRSKHVTLVDAKSSKDLVKIYKRETPKKGILIKKSRGKDVYLEKSLRHKLNKKVKEPLKEEIEDDDEDTDDKVEKDVQETDKKIEGINEDGMTNLVESCRYYSNMLTNHLSKVKETVTKHLTTYYEENEEYMDLPHKASPIKPSTRKSWTDQRKPNVGGLLSKLTPSASLTDIGKNDKEHLKSVYTILSAIEGRLRRFNMDNGKSLPSV